MIKPQMTEYEQLAQQTVITSTKLIEYFRMNLIYYQLVSGKGLEFDRIKDYVVGDDPRRIDWKILARTQKLMVRKFKEEREFDIVICIDVSDSMLLGTTKHTKNEFAGVVGGALAFASLEAKDNAALVMLSDEHTIATDPDGQFFDALTMIADPKNYGGGKGWDRIVNTLVGGYNSDAIIFIISDFIDTKPRKWLPELASSFTKVYGIMIRDPIDLKLPANVGRMYLQDIQGKKKYLTNLDSVREQYEIMVKKEIKDIRSAFEENDQLFFEISTVEDFAEGFIKALGQSEVIIS